MVARRRTAPIGSGSSLELALTGILGVVIAFDAGLWLVAPTGATEHTIRLGLSGLAVLVLALGVACGVRLTHVYTAGTVLAAPFVAMYVYTGLLLPWTQSSFVLGQAGLEALLSVPVVGPPLAAAVFGGFTLTPTTRHLAATYHYAIVGLGMLAFVGLLWHVTGRGGREVGDAPAGR